MDRCSRYPAAVRIFEPDAARRGELPERTQLDTSPAAAARRIQLVVQQTSTSPATARLMNLLKLFSHAIQINRTHEEIASLRDAFMVLMPHYRAVRSPGAIAARSAAR